MRYTGNLKLGQWKKLFIMFKSSVMQTLNIFGSREGFYFEFQCLEEFEIYLKKVKRGWAHWSVALSLLACTHHAIGARSRPQPPPFHCCHRTAATDHRPTWARPYPRVGDAVEMFSLPFTPSRLSVDVFYAAPHVYGIINIALLQEYSPNIIFIFSQGRKNIYLV
jgi:hypothetical protein